MAYLVLKNEKTYLKTNIIKCITSTFGYIF